jgi:GMP synthase-like glutamine amidotransferase
MRTRADVEWRHAGVRAFILSGSATHVPDMSPEQYAANEAAMRSGLPVLGICFGAQFIATYYGGALERMPRFLCAYRTVTDLAAGAAGGRKFAARFCAQYRIAAVADCCVPQYTATLAGQKSAIVGFKHRDAPVFATLFHPEYDPATHHIIADFINTARRSTRAQYAPARRPSHVKRTSRHRRP